MKNKSLMSTILALAACAPKVPTTARATSTTAVQKTAPTGTKAPPTNMPTKAVTGTPTPEPTEGPTQAMTDTPVVLDINQLVINDQTVKGGNVLVSLVTAEKPGWVVIFTDKAGQPGTVLGYVAVPAGTSEDLKVPVDTAKVTGKMVAVLLVDAGTMGTFEYPGPDEFATESGHTVMAAFKRSTG